MRESSNNETADDEERDIADDPILSALDAELNGVSKRTDNTLLVVVLGIGLPLMLAFHVYTTGLIRTLGVILSVVVMICVIPFTMLRTVRLRRQVAIRYGLKCRSCGHNPGGMYALSTATVGRCRKCGAQLSPSLPSARR
jgi:hypothetical protein